jgi:trimethylamine--corrinoid protein Co-methyltransferase
MQPVLTVLSPEECQQVHERTLRLLEVTGLRVDSERARRILGEAGATVESSGRVRFPPRLVEASLRAAPRTITLGGRREGWNLTLDGRECTLGADGMASQVLDLESGVRRPGTWQDWQAATALIDALDPVGIYWCMLDPGGPGSDQLRAIRHWRRAFASFSKHIQDSASDAASARSLLEILQVVFGSRQAVQRSHPFSLLVCPLSPLVLGQDALDGYLELAEWQIPVAVMPMPLMGATAPASLMATLVIANCETLAMLCLVQAAAPGTPCLYAAVPSVVNPRTWRFSGGQVEHALLGAAVVQMARFYELPVEAAAGSTDAHVPGLQAGYERALNWCLPGLAWPDVLIGPGLLDGSVVFCLEQILVDIEIFARCRRLRRGIGNTPDAWLESSLSAIEPGGNVLHQRSTRDAMRRGEWYLSQVGTHGSYEGWLNAGRPDLLPELTARVKTILAGHQPLPLDPAVERELDRIEAAETKP